jgi:cyclase
MDAPQPTLKEISSGIYAYLQPTTGWSRNNAGLIVGREFAVLIDTLFDLPLTRAMLDAFRRVTDKPIRYVINTHSNGDHVHGNQLIEGATIIGHRNCRAEMMRFPPETFERLMRSEIPGRDLSYVRESFGGFDFRGLRNCPPTVTFDERMTLYVDDRQVELIHFGPAHTSGDAVVYLPAARVLFTGDLLFFTDTPVVWEGSIPNWIRALDRMAALDAEVVVPGHGPVCGKEGLTELRDYFMTVRTQCERLARDGVSPDDAARRVELGRFAKWSLPERLVSVVERAYREIGAIPKDAPLDALELLARMGRLRDFWRSRDPTA